MENNLRRIELENKKAKKIGLIPRDWEELIPLRIEWLKNKGLNPKHYDVRQHNIVKRFGY